MASSKDEIQAYLRVKRKSLIDKYKCGLCVFLLTISLFSYMFKFELAFVFLFFSWLIALENFITSFGNEYISLCEKLILLNPKHIKAMSKTER